MATIEIRNTSNGWILVAVQDNDEYTAYGPFESRNDAMRQIEEYAEVCGIKVYVVTEDC